MLNNLLKYRQFIPTEFLLPLLAVLCNINLFIDYDYSYPAKIHGFLGGYFEPVSLHWMIAQMFVVWLTAQSFFVNAIAYENQLTKNRNALYGGLFIVLTSLFNKLLIALPAFWGGLFLIMALRSLLATYNNKQVSHLFNTGFWVGISSCFYPAYYWLLLVVFIGYLITRIFSLKEWLITFIGFIVPVYLYAVGLYFFDVLFAEINSISQSAYFVINLPDINNWEAVIKLSLLFVCFLFALWIIQERFLRISIEERKKLSMCLWFILIGLVLINVFGLHWQSHLMFLLAPLSILTAYGLDYIEPIFKAELLPIVLILSLVLFHYINQWYSIL